MGIHVGFVGDKMTLGQVFLRDLRFLSLSHHSNSTLAVGSGPIIIQKSKET